MARMIATIGEAHDLGWRLTVYCRWGKRLLTEKQLTAWLGISAPTLQRLRAEGSGPRFIQLSARRIA
jgi:predicted DNA-binding transcriptional regulator AlpA